MLYAIVALLVIILDQWTKFWVAGHIALNTGSRELIPGLIKLVNIHNDGAALGFLSGKNAGMLFIILCAVFTIFVIVALATKLIKSSVGRWSLLFIMAGGLSNCIDRLLSGYVQDMFMPTFMDNLPIFNVADIFITVFCLVFILFVLFGGKSDEDEDDESDEEEYEDDEDEEVEEDEDEDEEEEEAPARSHIKSLFKSARRDEGEDEDEEEEDEDEDEEEEEKPARRRVRSLFKSARRDEDEDEDEEEEDEDEEAADEEEEDDAPPPARRPSKYDRAARTGDRPVKHKSALPWSRVEDDDEEEEDEAEEKPVRKPRTEKKPSTRRDRQAELDEKYARFKAERAAREQQWSAAAQEEEKPAVVDPADPFAEWDAANAAQGRTNVRPAAPVESVPAAPVESAPAAPEAPKAAKGDDDMNFTLEDILAEFK